MSKKLYINRPEWMEQMEKHIGEMIEKVLRKKYNLSDGEEIPPYVFMSVNHNKFEHVTEFNIRVMYRNHPEYITINLIPEEIKKDNL